MSRDESSTPLRILIRATVTVPSSGDDIANIVTDPIPDGAQCFVIENRTLYRFRKFSTQAAASTSVIAPNAGGGRWVREGMTAGLEPAMAVALDATNTVDSTSTTNWLEPATAQFVKVFGSAGIWTFTAAGAIFTYNGPPGFYLARLTASVSFGVSAFIRGVVSFNNDLVAAETGIPEGAQVTELNDGGTETAVITAERVVSLDPTDTLRPKFRASVTDDDIDIVGFTLSVTPIQ